MLVLIHYLPYSNNLLTQIFMADMPHYLKANDKRIKNEFLFNQQKHVIIDVENFSVYATFMEQVSCLSTL